jgi:hypothetical protein
MFYTQFIYPCIFCSGILWFAKHYLLGVLGSHLGVVTDYSRWSGCDFVDYKI